MSELVTNTLKDFVTVMAKIVWTELRVSHLKPSASTSPSTWRNTVYCSVQHNSKDYNVDLVVFSRDEPHQVGQVLLQEGQHEQKYEQQRVEREQRGEEKSLRAPYAPQERQVESILEGGLAAIFGHAVVRDVLGALGIFP